MTATDLKKAIMNGNWHWYCTVCKKIINGNEVEKDEIQTGMAFFYHKNFEEHQVVPEANNT